ncbi:hypothetical protein [Reichenbachiella ulvae]|uniref:FlgN protein n=1 Tax=Reichenbachiella ulvae TaxID=2980104 RepID=A0ABT3CTD7_9BACT|nr:hypothetical protein [Reichenbachiella ulvae]MCV9386503.1 hypothetical protein [Reichenbachiella ulvae]
MASKFRLKNISTYIQGVSSSDQLNLLQRNKEILRHLSYLESLLVEHEIITDLINESSSSKLWPLLTEYDSNQAIVNIQKELSLSEEPTVSDTVQDTSILDNKEYLSQVQWSRLKVLRLIQINQAIHLQIERSMKELKKAIEEA